MAVTVGEKLFLCERRSQGTLLSPYMPGTSSLSSSSGHGFFPLVKGTMKNTFAVVLLFLLALSLSPRDFVVLALSSSSVGHSGVQDVALRHTGAIVGLNEVFLPASSPVSSASSSNASADGGVERRAEGDPQPSPGFLKAQPQHASLSSAQSIRPYHTKPSQRASEYSFKSGIPLCQQCPRFSNSRGDGGGCKVCIHGEISSDVSSVFVKRTFFICPCFSMSLSPPMPIYLSIYKAIGICPCAAVCGYAPCVFLFAFRFLRLFVPPFLL